MTRHLFTTACPRLHRTKSKVTIVEVMPAVLWVPRKASSLSAALGGPRTRRATGHPMYCWWEVGVRVQCWGLVGGAWTEVEAHVQKARRALCTESHTPVSRVSSLPLTPTMSSGTRRAVQGWPGASAPYRWAQAAPFGDTGPVAFHSCQKPRAGGMPPGSWASCSTPPGHLLLPMAPSAAPNEQRPPLGAWAITTV